MARRRNRRRARRGFWDFLGDVVESLVDAIIRH
jgi:hypothetical protein